MNLKFAIIMAGMSFFNATQSMESDDLKKLSFHALLTFGLKNSQNPAEQVKQFKALTHLNKVEVTPAGKDGRMKFVHPNITDSDDRACFSFLRPKIEQKISILSDTFIAEAPCNSDARKITFDLKLMKPRALYADIISCYHTDITKNNAATLITIPHQEQIAALTECRQFFKQQSEKKKDIAKYKNHLIKLHDIHGILAQQSQSLSEATPHLRAVVDLHPTNATRHALIYSLLGTAHEDPSQKKNLCHEAQQNLAKVTVKKGANDNFRFHTLLSAELSNLTDNYDETLKLMRPLGEDPSAQMYSAAAYFFKKDYEAGCRAIATVTKNTAPSPELLNLYKRSRCKEAMIPLWEKTIATVPSPNELNSYNKAIITRFGTTIAKAEQIKA